MYCPEVSEARHDSKVPEAHLEKEHSEAACRFMSNTTEPLIDACAVDPEFMALP